MTNNEKELAKKFLKIAADHFSNHGCNDVDEDFFDGFTEIELQNLAQKIEIWNNSPEEYDPERSAKYYSDWLLMYYLADNL